MLLLTLSQTARAGEWDKLTVLTFPSSVQVPGAVLAPGTYVFKLGDSLSNRDIVMVYDRYQQHLVTSVLAMPAYRVDTSNDSIVRFAERPADQPPAIAEWFYPGDNFGQEFIYPSSGSRQMAQLNTSESPAQSDQTTTPSQDNSTPAATMPATTTPATPDASQTPAPPDTTPAATPDTTQSQPSTATTPAPADNSNMNSNATTTSTDTAQLPKTASPLPLVGLLGMLFVAAGFALRRKARA